jgi:hypothetical protein
MDEAMDDAVYALAVVLLLLSLFLIMSKSNSLNKQERLRKRAETASHGPAACG